jgi:hypothetical protein
MASIRAAIEQDWRASESGAAEAEHVMYSEDATLDYPQSGERFRGRVPSTCCQGVTTTL